MLHLQKKQKMEFVPFLKITINASIEIIDSKFLKKQEA